MAGLTIGVGLIYERDTEASFNQDFVRVLGLWCGVLTLGKEATVRVASKVAIAQFKRVPAVIFQRINQRVGVTIVTKYGTKRGGVAAGRLCSLWRRSLCRRRFQLGDNEGVQESCDQVLQDGRCSSIRCISDGLTLLQADPPPASRASQSLDLPCQQFTISRMAPTCILCDLQRGFRRRASWALSKCLGTYLLFTNTVSTAQENPSSTRRKGTNRKRMGPSTSLTPGENEPRYT